MGFFRQKLFWKQYRQDLATWNSKVPWEIHVQKMSWLGPVLSFVSMYVVVTLCDSKTCFQKKAQVHGGAQKSVSFDSHFLSTFTIRHSWTMCTFVPPKKWWTLTKRVGFPSLRPRKVGFCSPKIGVFCCRSFDLSSMQVLQLQRLWLLFSGFLWQLAADEEVVKQKHWKTQRRANSKGKQQQQQQQQQRLRTMMFCFSSCLFPRPLRSSQDSLTGDHHQHYS